MDQDSFRRMLQTPRAGGSSVLGVASGSKPKLAVPPKKKTVDPSEPTFKPRKVKKTSDSKYRDRAAERRVGDGNDYAHIEAILEDFEKKNADEEKEKVEAQRKYLGGDSEHSILVKGLDFALLEQNKAKAVLSKDDVDDLEAAFLEASSHSKPPVPKKRTREDMLQELKQKRAQQPGPQGATTNFKSPEDDTKMLEDAKQKGKFKPIGFKPIGSSTATKKKAISEGDGEKKKKKRKVDAGPDDKRVSGLREAMPPPPVPTPKETLEPVIPEELADDDFDIFADAGEYMGIEVGDDDDDDEKDSPAPKALESKQEGLEDGEEPSSIAPRRWIAADDELGLSRKPEVKPQSPQRDFNEDEDEDMEDDRPMRLAPLESSTLPSIRDLLEMDKAAGSYGKKKKRSDKKKAGSGGVADEGDGEDGPKKKSLEAKVDRDYKRLKSYTEKKSAAGGR